MTDDPDTCLECGHELDEDEIGSELCDLCADDYYWR